MNEALTPTPAVSCQVLAGQALVFGLLGRAFYVSPDREWIQTLATERVFDEVPFATGQPDVAKGLGLLVAWTEASQNGLATESFAALRADYTRLFEGPGPAEAPPWESVYFHDEPMLFQEETIQVREWYARFGLQAEMLHSEPDDHAGLELVFLAHLAGLGAAACEAGEAEKLSWLVSAQQEFAAEHPAKWVPAWCDKVVEHARTDFYRGIALVTRGALAELSATGAASGATTQPGSKGS
jgi:putative dimethyl sulfoxide reductase chaperone